ncbi:MAG TPA: hypothetical protein VJ873_10175 [bacterium]|nr:hypothetical protein [bacterium]
MAASTIFAQGNRFKDDTITGPYTQKNLLVFLVHGKERVQSARAFYLIVP